MILNMNWLQSVVAAKFNPLFSATAASGIYCRNGRVSFEKTKKMGFFEVDKSVWTCFPPIPIRCTCTCLHFRAPTHTVPHTQSNEMLNRNALIFGSTIYGIIFWQKCAPLLRSKVPGKSAKKIVILIKIFNYSSGPIIKECE